MQECFRTNYFGGINVRKLVKISLPEGGTNNLSEQDKKDIEDKYKSVSKNIRWSYGVCYIEIYSDLPEYSMLVEQLQKNDFYYRVQSKIEFSKKELEEAQFLSFNIKHLCENTYTNNFNQYFLEETEGSSVHTIQCNDLEILKSDLGNRDIVNSTENEYIVSNKLKEILEAENFEEVSFRPVYTKKKHEHIAYQIIIGNYLPCLHSKTDLKIGNDDWRYNIRSYIMKEDTVLYYPREILTKAKDFNLSSEYFGTGIFPRPMRVVSQRVRQLFIKNKIKGIDFEPIFLVD